MSHYVLCFESESVFLSDTGCLFDFSTNSFIQVIFTARCMVLSHKHALFRINACLESDIVILVILEVREVTRPSSYPLNPAVESATFHYKKIYSAPKRFIAILHSRHFLHVSFWKIPLEYALLRDMKLSQNLFSYVQ